MNEIEDLNNRYTVITSIISKWIYRFEVILIKILARFFFVEIMKLILTQIEKQRTQNSQNDFENKAVTGILILPDFKTYCKSNAIMTV